MRQKIELNTMTDVRKFVEVASYLDDKITLEDDEGHAVSAKSLLGAIYSMEWSSIYCCSEKSISAYILPWIV